MSHSISANQMAATMSQKHRFEDITETAGDEVTEEQISRILNRYAWAVTYCKDRDVLEVACGTGQGLGLLKRSARFLVAGDLNLTWIAKALDHYRGRIPLAVLDATALPFGDDSVDTVVFFETLYFLQDQDSALSEIRRVLRDRGVLLLASANPDAPDFHPYPYAARYHGVPSLRDYLAHFGFSCEFFGDTLIRPTSVRERVLRAAKMAAVNAGLVPSSKRMKRIAKRFVYGTLQRMPAEITEATGKLVTPAPIPANQPDRLHRIYFCAATCCKSKVRG